MPKRIARTLSKRTVDALSVANKETVFWDHSLPGFGVRVYPSGRKVYVVQSRGPSGSRRVTVGVHGKLSPDQARKQATAIIARVKAGEEPLPPPALEPESEPTVADLAVRYMREHVAMHCKASSAGHYRISLDKYILPALGAIPVRAVGREDVAALHLKLRDTPYAANRVLLVLTKMFSLAETWGLRAYGTSPCRLVRRYHEHRRERFLTNEEFRRLGQVLDEAESGGGMGVRAARAIRLLMLTGCRRNEILTLRWGHVDLKAGELRLRDTKTGARMVPLSPTAARVLEGGPRIPGNPWVFPGVKTGAHLSELTHWWKQIRARAGLPNLRLHDLRHSFASRALALGESLPMIGKLLGHSQLQTTARYAHLARDAVHTAASDVADSIGADILPQDLGAG